MNNIPQDLVIKVKNATDLYLAGLGQPAIEVIPEYRKMSIEEKQAVILEMNLLENQKLSMVI